MELETKGNQGNGNERQWESCGICIKGNWKIWLKTWFLIKNDLIRIVKWSYKVNAWLLAYNNYYVYGLILIFWNKHENIIHNFR